MVTDSQAIMQPRILLEHTWIIPHIHCSTRRRVSAPTIRALPADRDPDGDPDYRSDREQDPSDDPPPLFLALRRICGVTVSCSASSEGPGSGSPLFLPSCKPRPTSTLRVVTSVSQCPLSSQTGRINLGCHPSSCSCSCSCDHVSTRSIFVERRSVRIPVIVTPDRRPSHGV